MSDTPRVTTPHPYENIVLAQDFESLCCQICGNICAKACLCHDCQLPYCHACLKESETCSCGALLEENTINISTFFEAVLKDVPVACGFEDCEFEAKYQDVLDHVKVCPMRDYTCPDCDEEMQHLDAELHAIRCAERLVDCPNKCKRVAIPRKELANHQKVCKRRPVSCRFAKNGCDFKGDFKSYMHHLVDCEFDAPVDHKRKVDQVEEESEEEEAKPLKKRRIIPEDEETTITEDKIETVEEVTEPAEPSKIMEVLLQNPMVVTEAHEVDEEEEPGDASEPDENASSEEESESEDERETAEEIPVAQTPEDSEEDAEGQEAIPNSPERASEKVEDAIVAPSAGIFSKIRKIVSSMSSGNLETLESVEQAM